MCMAGRVQDRQWIIKMQSIAHCYALPLANFISAFACCRLKCVLFPGLHSLLCLRALLQASRHGLISSGF